MQPWGKRRCLLCRRISRLNWTRRTNAANANPCCHAHRLPRLHDPIPSHPPRVQTRQHVISPSTHEQKDSGEEDHNPQKERKKISSSPSAPRPIDFTQSHLSHHELQAWYLFPFATLTTPPFPQRPLPRPLDRSRNPLSAHLGKSTPAWGLRRDALERADCSRSVRLPMGDHTNLWPGDDLACSWRDGWQVLMALAEGMPAARGGRTESMGVVKIPWVRQDRCAVCW